MRINGTKYNKVNILPAGALPVSVFARQMNWATAYVYIKYNRHDPGYINKKRQLVQAPNPGFKIVCYEGMNYVISED